MTTFNENDSKFVLSGLPMPPSINAQLMPAWSQKRFVKTKVAKQFDVACEAWRLTHRVDLKYYGLIIRTLVANGNILALDLNFYFPESELFTKTDTVKRMDLNNRMKSAIDAVSTALGVDDSVFFSHTAQKMVSDNDTSYIWACVYKVDPVTFGVTRKVKGQAI